MISRRRFLATAITSILAAPRFGEAQVGKVARLGLLSDESPAALEYVSSRTLLRALGDLGWREGHNLTIESRHSAGKNEILPSLAADLVRLKVNVIVAIGTPAARAAKNSTETTPIVFARVGDPVGFGLVSNLARPNGNVTGVSIITVDLGPKRLELLKEAIPGVARVGVLWDPSFPPAVPELRDVERAAHPLRVELYPRGVRRAAEFESALTAMTRQRVGAVLVLSAQLWIEHASRLVELATRARLPMMFGRREIVEAGGLMSYGPDLIDMYQRAAIHVDRILKGAKPADLPVEQSTKVALAINLKTAKALGLTIPQSLLLRADQLIDR